MKESFWRADAIGPTTAVTPQMRDQEPIYGEVWSRMRIFAGWCCCCNDVGNDKEDIAGSHNRRDDRKDDVGDVFIV